MLQKRFIVGGVLVLAAVGALLYTGFKEGTVYYYTIQELKDGASTLVDEEIRVTGQVVDGSLNWEEDNLTVRFTITDEGETLPVVYDGVAPDNLLEGREVVVNGTYERSGIFLANSILTKCPSKYEPQ